MVLLWHQGWGRSNLCNPGIEATKEEAGRDKGTIWQHLVLYQGTDLPVPRL